MKYEELCKIYERLEATSSRLDKTEILANFLHKLKKEKNKEIIYLLRGSVFPDYSQKEVGISAQLAIKAISKATGIPAEDVVEEWKKSGDLGKTAEKLVKKKKQITLFQKELTTEKVLENLRKAAELEGPGTIEKKISLLAELLSAAKPIEARYLIRTVLGELRVGTGEGIMRDAITWACFGREKAKEYVASVEAAYDKANDFAAVFEAACHGVKKLEEIMLVPGKPVKVMLALKAKNIADAFEQVGKPAAFEFKYDGFRMMLNKSEDGKITIFTRRLEDVTKQFPEVVEYVKKYIKAKSFIIDSEAVGYSPRTKKYRPFQEISQRIKRKYDIEKLSKELPVEVNVFDIIYYNGKSLLNEPFRKRSELLRKIVKGKKLELKPAEQLITDSESKAESFFRKALKAGHEGLMAKNLDAPYKPGARVGYMLKIKPEEKEFDLVIVGAEYGTGKRGGWLSSFVIACRDEKTGNFLEVGKVGTGIKEKQEVGLSFDELTKMLKPLIVEEHGRDVRIKPKIVVTVVYQNIQKSPKYASGFALRFPRITRLRPDRSPSDIATLSEIREEWEKETGRKKS